MVSGIDLRIYTQTLSADVPMERWVKERDGLQRLCCGMWKEIGSKL
jgi:hypothetical protein